jgi:superfamily II DNA or RNA helicase
MTQHNKEQQQLIGLYRKLDPTIQEIVQVAAVCDPMARTNLFTLAVKAGVRHEDGSVPNYKNDRDAINAAIESGILEYVANSKTGPVQPAVLLDDYVFRQAFASGFAERVKKQIESQQTRRYSYGINEHEGVRKMRFAFYGDNWKAWQELVRLYSFRPYLLDPFCQRTFESLSPKFQAEFFTRSAMQVVNFGDSRRSELAACTSDLIDGMKNLPDDVIVATIDLLTAQGNISELEKLAVRVVTHPEIEGCAAFLRGDLATARQQFEAADQQQRKRTRKRSTNLPHLPMVLYAILLLKENSAQSQKHVKQIIKTMDKWDSVWHLVSIPFEKALAHQVNPLKQTSLIFFDPESMSPLSFLIGSWIWSWYFADQTPPFTLKTVEKLSERYRDSNVDWIAAEFSAIAARMATGKTKPKKLASQAEETHSQLGTASIVDLLQPAPPWEAGLNALENLCQPAKAAAVAAQDSPVADERLLWEAEFGKVWVSVTPYIQKYSAKGWSKGRKVALGRLYEQWQTSTFDFLTDQDQRICKALRQYTERNYRGYRETYHEWDQAKLVSGLVGHPHLYQPGKRDEPIQISEGRPHLTIKRSGKKIRLAVEPKPGLDNDAVNVTQEGSHRYYIVQFSIRQREVASLVAGLPAVPPDQQDRVFKVAESLASVIDVQSDIEGAPSTGEEVDATSQIVAQLTPYQDGLRAELFVQPLGEKGPFCRPGAGAQAMLANVEGKALTTTRDLKTEQKNLQQLLGECRPLEARTVSDDQTEWLFAESDDALEFVVELQTLADQDKVSVLWPRGKTHDVAGSPSASGFQVSVRRDRDWFAASGQLKVDSDLTVDLMKLLDLSSASPSRFVRLDDGRFLALSQQLRQRIADIAAFGTPMKNKLRFAPVRALVVDELFDNVSFKTDKHWKSHLSRIEEAGAISVDVPSTLQADLRDYQFEGYAWLKRLAHWNTGACLADDMGLGKTIQALALLVDRAFDGPQLVVAPASVGFNWESESHRFAPTLTPKLFRDGDRDQFFDDIQPGDLVITSYGLLQSEIERFEAVQWRTVVLDEAQAIKNMATKRSQAVMQLEADFRIILTGTPMENHLGELWNLFRFIVPGLLGSQEEFRKRFAAPIERDNCRATRNRLRKLIQPFLLRRIKSEVLTELPARSESVLEVELSPAEAALYEALRQKALERIAEATADSTSQGEQHLQVLAELTRLRLACCHPSLVGGDSIDSTKVDLFRQKIGEIIDGNHKVLVFSQFVKHLDILRRELDEMGVSYQYLDGSTSVKKRKQAVEAFQSGEGDVFLISLKAGGTGLNLTAADYVIHMDPWWNPAVEDQATDRAHRIGQQRPVNVYRLITKGTIEEKIVDLHNTKRDLADSLLEGSDSSGKLTTEELIGLLKDNQLAEAAR